MLLFTLHKDCDKCKAHLTLTNDTDNPEDITKLKKDGKRNNLLRAAKDYLSMNRKMDEQNYMPPPDYLVRQDVIKCTHRTVGPDHAVLLESWELTASILYHYVECPLCRARVYIC